ncbi:MAG: class I SAM-dependent methyltransferase [Anaerolineae bacterium]
MQQQDKVIRQFEDQIDLYTDLAGPESSVVPFLVTPYLFDWLRENEAFLANRTPLKICEFGGGGGIVLQMIEEELGGQPLLVNAELVGQYGQRQISHSIRFVQTTILQAGLASDTFDVVIARNVLHHLIGDNLRQTRQNQSHVFAELLRVVKPGGLILIQEQVNQRRWACTLLYHLSRLASRLGLRIESFEVTPNTVIAYLTRRQLEALAEANLPRDHWQTSQYTRRPMPLRWRLTVLMSNNGDALLALRKPSETAPASAHPSNQL